MSLLAGAWFEHFHPKAWMPAEKSQLF